MYRGTDMYGAGVGMALPQRDVSQTQSGGLCATIHRRPTPSFSLHYLDANGCIVCLTLVYAICVGNGKINTPPGTFTYCEK